jgi:hypothetical protein
VKGEFGGTGDLCHAGEELESVLGPVGLADLGVRERVRVRVQADTRTQEARCRGFYVGTRMSAREQLC